MFEKCDVNGKKTLDVYLKLRFNSILNTKDSNTIEDIPWNFSKFLISGDGKTIKYFEPRIDPIRLIPEIERMLNSKK